MTSTDLIHGSMRQYQSPDWRPLEELLGCDDLCGHFMWMHDVELDHGTTLNAYTHRWTRCYFHLAGDGRTFRYVGTESYAEMDPAETIRSVFMSRGGGEETPEEKKALRAAIRRARVRGRVRARDET